MTDTPGYTPPRLGGTGEVDIGAWLNAGWYTVTGDIGTFMLATLMVSVLSVFSVGICAGPLTVGLYMMILRRLQGQAVQAGDVFDGFRWFGSAFVAWLLITLASMGIALVSSGPSMVIQVSGGDDVLFMVSMFWSYGARFILTPLLQGAVLFTFAHIAATGASPMDAISASFEVFKRNILLFALTALLFQIITGLGTIACCVGVLVSVPIVMAATAQAYIDHFGLGDIDAV